MEDKNPKFEIHHKKNPLYRTIYVDGMIGGKTPTNAFNFSFYATRNVIPKSVTHLILPDGTIDENPIKSDDSKNGIIHEIEFGVYMNEETARNIYDLLKTFFDGN